MSDSVSAVVVIPAHRPEPSAWEALAIRHNARVLGAHPVTFALPDGMDPGPYVRLAPRAAVTTFPSRLFRSNHGNNRLCLLAEFYQRFADQDYLLKCEPDAWVFEDQLSAWCREGHSYTGSPTCVTNREGESVEEWLPVQNGGFSLRNIAHHLAVLCSERTANLFPGFERAHRDWTRMAHRGRDTFVSRVRRVAKMPGWLRPEKPIGWYMDRFFDGETRSLAEDQFLCRYASLFDPAFCLAPTEEAMRFGLQDGHDVPRTRYAGVTPFGAHGPWYGQTAERFISKGDAPTTARECLYWGLLERVGVVGALPRGRIPADALGGFDRVFSVTSSGGRREGTAATKERNRGVPLGG